MKSWQADLERTLRERDAPAVLNRAVITRFARSARNETVPVSSLSHWIARQAEAGKLEPVQRGLYLNRMRERRVTLADTVPWLQRDAVVSLNTVLADAGVLNNPSRAVTAVVPIDSGAPPPPRLGRRQTRAGIVHFHGIPRAILEAGRVADRLQENALADHVRATPEKALIDWLYLGASSRSGRPLPPRADIDLDMLDEKRLARVARAAGVETLLAKWRAGATS